MKKVLLFIVLFISITGIAATIFLTHKTRIPKVSENVNIPYFIDTLMEHEKNKMVLIASDSNSIESRLTNLGFTAKSGNVFNNYNAKAICALYDSYNTLYPTHQFINYRGVNEVMKKFGLVFGAANSFICDIPKGEIDSIESFKPSYIFDRNNWYPLHDLSFTMEELSNRDGGYGSIAEYINDTYYRISIGRGKLSKETNLPKYSLIDKESRPLKSTVYFLLAPAKCFNGEANYQGNYGDIKDPIVLAPVEGGYIRVTAW